MVSGAAADNGIRPDLKIAAMTQSLIRLVILSIDAISLEFTLIICDKNTDITHKKINSNLQNYLFTNDE